MTTTLSLLTPSGRLTLGNLLGALRPMAQRQDDAYYGLSDLHAMTTTHDPDLLRSRTLEMATLLLAAGLDRATLFRQSQVPAHAGLAYLLECTAYTGELNRMVQFKEKGGRVDPRPSRAASCASDGKAEEGDGTESRRLTTTRPAGMQGDAQQATGSTRPPSGGVAATRVSLYTYPVLMAADILLYRPAVVPVGDDQRQHVELTRDLAIRFNRAYGEVFTVPEITTPAIGARVMDLADPTRKMSKSADAAGSIFLLDPPDLVRRKVSRAVTDSETGSAAVRVDREAKPGVTNLLDILVACGGSADGITTYGALKKAVTDAVVAELEPIRKRYADLAADAAHVTRVFADGAARCREVTAPVLAAAEAAIGLA